MRKRLEPLYTLAGLLMMGFAGGTMSADPATTTPGETPSVIWKTSGSVTFATADGADLWLIEANGGLDDPKASLVRISPSGATRVSTFPGRAFSPSADNDYVYLVVDNRIVRVGKHLPYEATTLRKGEVWPIGTAVDSGYVYFTNQTTQGLDGGPSNGKPGSVAKMKKGGDGFERLSGMTARNLVLDADNVYFSSDTSVCAVSKHGGPVRTLVADAGQSPDLAIDGDWLVYTRAHGVSRCNIKSAKIEALANDVDIPLFVAAAGGTTYLGANLAFQGPGKSAKPAEILRLRPGHTPECLWSGMNRLTSMVLAAGRIYFTVEPLDGTEGASLLRIDAGGRRGDSHDHTGVRWKVYTALNHK